MMNARSEGLMTGVSVDVNEGSLSFLFPCLVLCRGSYRCISVRIVTKIDL